MIANEKLCSPNRKDIKTSLIAIISTLELIGRCLEAADIQPQEPNEQPNEQVRWLTNSKNEPFTVYIGTDLRTIQLLVSSSYGIVTYGVSESIMTIVQKQFWSVQEQLHRYALDEPISLLCCNIRIKEEKKIGRITYAPLNDFAANLNSLPKKKYENLSMHDSIVLFNLYNNNPLLKESDLLMDRFNYIGMKLIKHQNSCYKRLSRRICQGDIANIENAIAEANLSEGKTSQLRNQLRKVINFNEVLEMRRNRESEDRKYQNIKNLEFEDLQVGHLEVANSATLDQWVKEMQATIKQAYNNISNNKDFKTKTSLILLRDEYANKLEQLRRQCQPLSRAEKHAKTLQRQLDWFYGYHERYLREEFFSTIKYCLNQLLYLARQKSLIIQKVLIILLALILIELFSENSFVTVTLTLVVGIFYLRL